jgi:hypothetical protein
VGRKVINEGNVLKYHDNFLKNSTTLGLGSHTFRYFSSTKSVTSETDPPETAMVAVIFEYKA